MKIAWEVDSPRGYIDVNDESLADCQTIGDVEGLIQDLIDGEVQINLAAFPDDTSEAIERWRELRKDQEGFKTRG